jgi:hypothetical protein
LLSHYGAESNAYIFPVLKMEVALFIKT